MINYVVFVFIIASLVFYVRIAWKIRHESLKTSDDYYLAKGTVRPSQFAVTQTAYQLQMATIYPFFLFAFLGSWWIGIVNDVGYILGILIYFVLLPLFSRGSANIVGKSSTVHAAIANLHSFPRLRQLTAWMTVIAFSGLAAFEITWGSRVFRVLFDGGDSVYYLAIATLALYLVLYVWAGGQRANITSAQYRLFFAYAGLHSLVAWFAWHDGVTFGGAPFAVLVPAIVVFSAAMLFIRMRIGQQDQPRYLKNLNILTIVSLLVMLAGIVPKLSTLHLSLVNTVLPTITSDPSFWWAALSVGLLPLFFQFVDTSNWQRLTSLITNPANRVIEARKGLRQYLIESPLSWLLPIFIGLCAAQFLTIPKDGEPWDELLRAVLNSNGLVQIFLPIVVFVGVVAIFMSTAEDFLTTVGYVYAYDLSRRSRLIARRSETSKNESAEAIAKKNESDEALVKKTGRAAMSVATAIVVIGFIVGDLFFGGSGKVLIGLFLAFYAPLVALAPSLVVPAVTGRVAHKSFVLMSLGLGALSGFFFGVVSLFFPSAFGGNVTWFGSLAAFGVSWVFYLVGLIGGTKITAGPSDVR